MKTWNITQLVKIARNDTPFVRRLLGKAGIVPAKHIVINGKDWSQWGRDAFDCVTAHRAAKDAKHATAAVPKAATYNITTLRRVAGKSAVSIRAALYAAGITEVEKHELTPTGKDYSRWGQDAYDFAYAQNKRNRKPVQQELPLPEPEVTELMAPAEPAPTLPTPKPELIVRLGAVEHQLQMLNDKFDRMLAVWEK